MAEPSPSTDRSSGTTAITDVNIDSLVHCATHLNLQDISNMAMSCKYLRRVAYSDSIWQRFSREQWTEQISSGFLQTSSVREGYLARHTALQQLKFVDPLVADFYVGAKPHNIFLLPKNNVVFCQGSLIHVMIIDSYLRGVKSFETLSDHRARITCVRFFPLYATSLFHSETQGNGNVMLTSSCDHSVRLWWKGSCQRCFRGHNGPVCTLSDKLLGDGIGEIFASGGGDATVRLWSLSSRGKRGQQALKATLYGHEKPVVLMAVAGHKTSLLVSMSTNSKVRVWDTTASSAVRSSCCVGVTSVPGAPVGLKCHESLVYVAAGSSVVAIDLRTMQKVFTASTYQQELHSFDVMPSKSLICAGGIDRGMLWDIRRSTQRLQTEPVAKLEGHTGAVTQLHMDPYKIVTGGPDDRYIKVWETDTGMLTNSFICCSTETRNSSPGCSAMAVDGCQIVSAGCGEEHIRYRDFTNAMTRVSSDENGAGSKFWGAHSDTDSNDTDSDGDY